VVKVKKERMTPADRMMLAMGLEEPDRVPVGFLPLTIGARLAGVTVDKFSQDAKLMAKGQMVLYERFAPDFVLPFPDVSSIAEAWNTKTKFVEESTPYTIEFAVKKPEDWEDIDIISPNEWWSERGRIPIVLEAQDILIDKYESELPVLGLMASPLTIASWIAGLSMVSKDMIKNPDLLNIGLDRIAESMINLVKAYYDNGIAVCYMACTRATREIYGLTQYVDFGVTYDLKVLNACKSYMTFMGHVCGREPYLELLTPLYPFVGVNFWDRGAVYDLAFAKKKYGSRIPVIGGVDQTTTLLYGTPRQVEAECIDAIRQAAAGGGFVLAPGCELSHDTPDENIAAVTRAAREYGTYPISEKVLSFKYEKPARIGV